jgi:hypothetical protein
MFTNIKYFVRLIAPLAIGLCAIASTAQAESPYRFTHEKSGYKVVSWANSDGSARLRGVHPDGRTFDIQVSRKGRVTGIVSGQPVDYILDKKTLTELAMN